MNLWLRLLALLVRAGRRPKTPLGVDAVAHTPFRVWPTDLDTNWHMNNGRYLTLMDLGRLHYMAEMGLMWRALRGGLLPVLGASQAIFLRPLLLGQRFVIATRLAMWDERWFVMRQEFLVKDKLHTKAMVRGTFRRRGQLVAPAEVMRLGGQEVPTTRSAPPDVQAWLDSLKAQRQPPADAPGREAVPCTK